MSPEGETHTLSKSVLWLYGNNPNCGVCGSSSRDMHILVRGCLLLLLLPFSQHNRFDLGNTSVQCFSVWRAGLWAFWWML